MRFQAIKFWWQVVSTYPGQKQTVDSKSVFRALRDVVVQELLHTPPGPWRAAAHKGTLSTRVVRHEQSKQRSAGPSTITLREARSSKKQITYLRWPRSSKRSQMVAKAKCPGGTICGSAGMTAAVDGSSADRLLAF